MMENEVPIEIATDIKQELTEDVAVTNDRRSFRTGTVVHQRDSDEFISGKIDMDYSHHKKETDNLPDIKEEIVEIEIEKQYGDIPLKQECDDFYEVKEEIDVEYNTENVQSCYEYSNCGFKTELQSSPINLEDCQKSPSHSMEKFELTEHTKAFHKNHDQIEHLNEGTGNKTIDIASNTQEKYECRDCHEVYRHKDNLDRHMISVHDKIKYECEICHKKFSRKYILEKHVQAIHGGLKHECEVCRKVFNYKLSLDKHVKATHDKIVHECEACHKTFYLRSRLDRHVKTIHNENKVKYECEACDKVFSYKSALDGHVKAIHSENRIKYECKECRKIFNYKSALVGHAERIHGENKIKYVCEICLKIFKLKQYLDKHMRMIHGKNKIDRKMIQGRDLESKS